LRSEAKKKLNAIAKRERAMFSTVFEQTAEGEPEGGGNDEASSRKEKAQALDQLLRDAEHLENVVMRRS